MLQSEILRILKSKRAIAVISIIILIPFIDFFENIYWEYIVYLPGGLPPKESVSHPCLCAFLSGSSSTMLAQMLLLWILPLYFLLIYSDNYITEKKLNYFTLIRTRADLKKFLLLRYRVAFVMGSAVMLVTLLLNWTVCLLAFGGGQNFRGLAEYVTPGTLSGWELSHPYITYAVRILLTSLIAGAVAAICQGASYLLGQVKTVYFACFLTWFILVAYPFSITYVMQPFSEYGLKYIIPGSLIFIVVSILIVMFGYRYKVKSDEC